ncbi:hypothetical protein V3851_17665 [Paenibacillus sp. M1]|uniref:DUF3829 domain-containing protein n=1 Tax=Paenibacillus haidiansis TaxID=1574488 RepID=A0ABU7VV59_9BACL
MTPINKRRVTIALAISAVLALTACSGPSGSEKPNNTPSQENTQNSGTENNDAAVNPGGDAAEGSGSPQLVAEFDSLLQESGKLPDAFRFVAEHADELNKEQVSHMLLALEEAQMEQFSDRVDSFYEGDMQERIAKIYEIGDTFDELIDKAPDEDLKSLLTETRDSGYMLATVEGMFNPDPDYRKLAEFGGKATEDVAAYLELKTKESAQRSLADAALVVSWEELVNRGLSAEAFTLKYPDSERIEEAKLLFANYKTTIFYGANNTPLFGYEDEKMDPEAQKAYESALAGANSGASPLLENLRKFMDEAAKGQYKLTASLEQLRGELVPLGTE